MLGTEFITIAIILRLAAGASYVVATWRGTARPNPVTWLFWGLAPLLAFVAQIQHNVNSAAWMTLVLSLGPLLVFLVSLSRHTSWRVGLFDVLCGGCAAFGLILWQITSNPALALWFAILADILGGVPTLVKAYKAPWSEQAFPYLLSVLSMVVTMLTIDEWALINYAFPLYIFCINLTIFTLVVVRNLQLGQSKPQAVGP